VDIGIVSGNSIGNKKLFQGFRVMGKIVNQGFDEKTIFNVNALISGDGDFKLLIMKYITPVFQFVAPDITFVKYRISDTDFPQEITAGQAGMSEHKIKGMVGGNAVEGIEFDHLIQWNQILDKGTDVVLKFTQIDINSLNNPAQQFFQFFHENPL